jgi:hypothetical protein
MTVFDKTEYKLSLNVTDYGSVLRNFIIILDICFIFSFLDLLSATDVKKKCSHQVRYIKTS